MTSYRHILAALDGSSAAEEILPHVEELAGALGSFVTLIQVVSLGGGIFPEPTHGAFRPAVEELRRETAAYLEKTAARLREKGVEVSYEMPEGAPAQVIGQRAQELGADLIAMTSSGRGGLERTLFGSVADKVLRTSDRPILLIRVGT